MKRFLTAMTVKQFKSEERDSVYFAGGGPSLLPSSSGKRESRRRQRAALTKLQKKAATQTARLRVRPEP